MIFIVAEGFLRGRGLWKEGRLDPEAGDWIKVGEAPGTPSQHGESEEPPPGFGLQSGIYGDDPLG